LDEDASLLARADKIITANIGSPRLTPDRIAELAGVSRSSLYRTFATRGGISEHILTLRLKLIRQDLESPTLHKVPINRLAEQRGFHNAASFTRTFRRHFGHTPGELRAGALPARDGATARPPDRTRFVDLLRSDHR
jgi:AraC-like DNA-binding protein